MAPKNPARYGTKNSHPLATTVDEQTYQAVSKLAATGGITVAAWLRQVIADEAKKSTVIGLSRLEPWRLNEEQMQPTPLHGSPIIDPSYAAPDGGSTIPQPTHAHQNNVRKSSS
jgi:hypothetical protein